MKQRERFKEKLYKKSKHPVEKQSAKHWGAETISSDKYSIPGRKAGKVPEIMTPARRTVGY